MKQQFRYQDGRFTAVADIDGGVFPAKAVSTCIKLDRSESMKNVGAMCMCLCVTE